MSLSVEVVGLTDFVKDIKRAGGDARPLIKAALFNSSREVQRNVRQRAPHRTGALQRSVLQTIAYPTAKVTVDEKYGEYIEKGTAPHLITPKGKKALFWKGAPNPYKSIKHPGTKAKPFFAPGVEASSEYIAEQFKKVINRLVSELAGR